MGTQDVTSVSWLQTLDLDHGNASLPQDLPGLEREARRDHHYEWVFGANIDQ